MSLSYICWNLTIHFEEAISQGCVAVGLAVEAQRQFLKRGQRRRRLRRRDPLTALVRQQQIPQLEPEQ